MGRRSSQAVDVEEVARLGELQRDSDLDPALARAAEELDLARRVLTDLIAELSADATDS